MKQAITETERDINTEERNVKALEKRRAAVRRKAEKAKRQLELYEKLTKLPEREEAMGLTLKDVVKTKEQEWATWKEALVTLEVDLNKADDNLVHNKSQFEGMRLIRQKLSAGNAKYENGTWWVKIDGNWKKVNLEYR